MSVNVTRYGDNNSAEKKSNICPVPAPANRIEESDFGGFELNQSTTSWALV